MPREKLTPSSFKEDLRCGRMPCGNRTYHLCNVCNRLALRPKEHCPLDLAAGRSALSKQGEG